MPPLIIAVTPPTRAPAKATSTPSFHPLLARPQNPPTKPVTTAPEIPHRAPLSADSRSTESDVTTLSGSFPLPSTGATGGPNVATISPPTAPINAPDNADCSPPTSAAPKPKRTIAIGTMSNDAGDASRYRARHETFTLRVGSSPEPRWNSLRAIGTLVKANTIRPNRNNPKTTASKIKTDRRSLRTTRNPNAAMAGRIAASDTSPSRSLNL